MGIIRNIFDKLKKRNTADSLVDADNPEENNGANEDESELLVVYSKIDRARQLSKIMSTTLDKREFVKSLTELKEVMTELVKYEGKYEIDPAPSKDLEYLEKVEKEQIELLEKRIEEHKKETVSTVEEKSQKGDGETEAGTEDVSETNALKVESTGEMENVADSSAKHEEISVSEAYSEIDRSNKLTDITKKITDNEKEAIAYNDRFYEDYRPIPRKTIAFTGNNFSEHAVEACAALIISGSVRRGEKIKPNDYYKYFENLYGVVNIRKLHIWLYENGYLRNATPKEALNLYKVPELKTILDSLGLKKNGNKSDLIDMILENIDNSTKERLSNECDRYFRSEKGERFLAENQDFVMFHKNQYGLSFQEFCEHRILQGRKRKFYDTIFHALSQRAVTWQVKKYISQLECVYHNLSNALYDEEKYELSLQNALYSLYFSTNLASKYYLFSLENVRFDGIETAMSRIDSESTFNPHIIARILELQPYFREQMLDVVYTPEILPYCLFGKYDILDVVLDLHEGKFDAEFYTNIIRLSYGNYAKKFL